MLTITCAIVLAYCIITLLPVIAEIFILAFEKELSDMVNFFIARKKTRPSIVYGRGPVEPLNPTRDAVLILAGTVLGIVLIVGSVVGFVGARDARVEHQRATFVMTQNGIVANMPGHEYYFAANGDIFLIWSAEPIGDYDVARQLLVDNVLSQPGKVEQLRSHGFRSVSLGGVELALK